MVRGLLAGQKTEDTPNARGIWGLYGSFDYISPYLFRVSSTALSLGTTRQFELSPDVAMQGSLLGGVGYGAAGTTTVIPSTPTDAAIRDYHFGVTPQALLTLRYIIGDRAMFDMTSRYYYVSGVGSDDSRGSSGSSTATRRDVPDQGRERDRAAVRLRPESDVRHAADEGEPGRNDHYRLHGARRPPVRHGELALTAPPGVGKSSRVNAFFPGVQVVPWQLPV